MAERLKNATSPYLLQHADNPVDWWPWSDEAFAVARARDVPVMLSVGYSACHWCHVMAHESFEDAETAELVNASFVAIKVDREERPDVDAVYMTVTQAMTGQGGWPMTVFMTPGARPFYSGTYFPRAAFQRLLTAVAAAWRNDRAALTEQAGRVVAALAEHAGPAAGAGTGQTPGATSPQGLAALGETAVAGLQTSYDARRGGFGGAPKFPPSMVLEFLLRHSERPPPGTPSGAAALAMAAGTTAAMARGGIYDQLGGGFARYSVDADWVVPHFEKMLYDNALLARVYAHLWRRTGDPLAHRVARETCAWVIRDLATPEGGFASALDADSEGEEGRFYVWTPAELRSVLGSEDALFAAEVFAVGEEGSFEGGRSVLQLPSDPADAERFAQVRERLLMARESRTRPARDDKVVTAWNGLAIAGLAECGLLLDEPGFISAASAAAALLTGTHLRDGRLVRTSRAGAAGPGAGVLEDYACLAEGLLVLAGVTGVARWADIAGQLLGTALQRFPDGAGGFYDTPDDGEQLMYRPADPADGPTPAGAFAMAGALLSYSALTGSAQHRDAAVAALGVLTPLASRYPRAAGAGLAVAEALVAGPPEVAVVGLPGDPRTVELHRTALLAAPPGAVVALGDGSEQPGGAGVPLLAGRGMVDGSPAAYVCRDFTCRVPVTDATALRGALGYPTLGGLR
ncbi:MAG TPA: thioredoxin domain-containing protein [Streptosporangiaceae bacterium]|nr:thioredoxin domain-containing protein [Streptosporangiaceae bacterium]